MKPHTYLDLHVTWIQDKSIRHKFIIAKIALKKLVIYAEWSLYLTYSIKISLPKPILTFTA